MAIKYVSGKPAMVYDGGNDDETAINMRRVLLHKKRGKQEKNWKGKYFMNILFL